MASARLVPPPGLGFGQTPADMLLSLAGVRPTTGALAAAPGAIQATAPHEGAAHNQAAPKAGSQAPQRAALAPVDGNERQDAPAGAQKPARGCRAGVKHRKAPSASPIKARATKTTFDNPAFEDAPENDEQHENVVKPDDVRGILSQYFAAGSAKERSRLILANLVPQKKLTRAKSNAALAGSEGSAEPMTCAASTEGQPLPQPSPATAKTDDSTAAATTINSDDPGSVSQLVRRFEAAANANANATAPTPECVPPLETPREPASTAIPMIVRRRARSATPRIGARSRSASRARRRANQLDKLRKAAALARRLGAEEARAEAEGEMGDLLACLGSESKKVEALTDFVLSSCPGEARENIQADIEALLGKVDEEAAGATLEDAAATTTVNEAPNSAPAAAATPRGRSPRRRRSASPAAASKPARAASPAAIASDVCRSVAVAAEEATRAATRAAEAAEVARQLMRDAAAMGINIALPELHGGPASAPDSDLPSPDARAEAKPAKRNRRRSSSRGAKAKASDASAPMTQQRAPSPITRGRSPVPRARQEWRPKATSPVV